MQSLGSPKRNVNNILMPPSKMSMQNNGGKKGGVMSFIKSMKFLALVIIVLQIIIIFILVNPINLVNQLTAVQVINKVTSKVVVPPSEVPQVIAKIGDITNLPTADELREENAIQAEIYKDAEDGDYVLLYTTKMIIYRASTDTVIYEGDTPSKVLSNAQQAILDKIVAKAKELDLIAEDSEEVPQLSVISDVTSLKQENPTFYKDAQANDVIGLFQTSSQILIYRPDTDKVVNSGAFNFAIQ